MSAAAQGWHSYPPGVHRLTGLRRAGGSEDGTIACLLCPFLTRAPYCLCADFGIQESAPGTRPWATYPAFADEFLLLVRGAGPDTHVSGSRFRAARCRQPALPARGRSFPVNPGPCPHVPGPGRWISSTGTMPRRRSQEGRVHRTRSAATVRGLPARSQVRCNGRRHRRGK